METFSWKGQLEKREVGNFWVGKLNLKLENFWLLNTILKTFQLRTVLSKINWNFRLSNSKFSNFRSFQVTFQTTVVLKYTWSCPKWTRPMVHVMFSWWKNLNTKQRNVLDEELHVRQRCEFIPVYIKLIMFGPSEQGS